MLFRSYKCQTRGLLYIIKILGCRKHLLYDIINLYGRGDWLLKVNSNSEVHNSFVKIENYVMSKKISQSELFE